MAAKKDEKPVVKINDRRNMLLIRTSFLEPNCITSPQVAETNTHRPMDVAREHRLYDEW